MEPEIKAVGAFTADIKTVANESGGYDITMSVPVEDRDGEVIDALAFDPVPEWIPIDVDHGMSVVTTVGSGYPAYDLNGKLKLNNFTFATTPLGKDVKTLVDEKHIRKMSVTFMGAKREIDEKDGKMHIRKAELLNAAIVAIPSNRDADIVLTGKSLLAVAGEDTIQKMHDRSAELGAVCTHDHAPVVEKSPATAPEEAAAPVAAAPPAAGDRVKAMTALVEAELALLP